MSSTASMEQPHHNIDPRGDLILDVSSDSLERSIRVSSKTLCLASPVFRTMLESPHFHEGTALQTATEAHPTKMTLVGDDYQSLLMVLQAVHFKARKIPATVTLDEFYQLAVICDKYDLAEVFVPWVNVWKSDFDKPGREPACRRWLVVSWVFRLSAVFETITKEMIYDVSLHTQDTPPPDASDMVEIGMIPDRVLNSIRDIKKYTAEPLISLAIEHVERYNSSIVQGLNVCQVTVPVSSHYSNRTKICPKRNACDSLASGSLLRCLVTAGLWPTPTKATSTIRDILNAFGGIKSYHWYLDQGNGHANCGSQKRLNDVALAAVGAIKGLKLSDFYAQDDIFFPHDG